MSSNMSSKNQPTQRPREGSIVAAREPGDLSAAVEEAIEAQNAAVAAAAAKNPPSRRRVRGELSPDQGKGKPA